MENHSRNRSAAVQPPRPHPEKGEGPGPWGPGPSRVLYPNQALPESFSRRAASWASLASEPPAGSAWLEEDCEPLSEE